MKKRYYWDSNEMTFKKVPIFNKVWVFIVIIGVIVLGYLTSKNEIVYLEKEIIVSNNQVIGSEQWKDSVFQDYTNKANKYLSRFNNTPIKGEMLSLAAHNAFDSTGILLPIELALAQAQLESSMGLKGRSPTKNPYNVGEHDSGTVMWFESTFDGIQAYYYYMCFNYLKCKSLDMLFKNFTNCNGKRYASNIEYENKLKQQYYYIKRILSNEEHN